MKNNTSISVRLTRALVAVILLAGNAVYAETPSSTSAATRQIKGRFDGTWKLAAPQVALKPVQGEIPFTAEGRKRYDANVAAAARNDLSFDHTYSRCSSPGLPRMMLGPMRFNIFERRDMIMVLFEWNRTFRQIDMRGKPLEPDDEVEQRNVGRSVGQWRGSTLVVESSGFSEDVLLDNFLPSSSDTRLTEHFSLVGKDRLQDRITITNPVLYSRPWETVLTFVRQPYAIFDDEDICLERRKAGKGTFPR